jgi:uncharacterized protein (TIGR02246 family)
MSKLATTTLALAMSISAGTALAEAEQATVDAVKALWEQQHKALDAHDIDGVMATYANSDDIMLMGTGPGEHWVGPAEVKDAYEHFMDGFDSNTMEVKCSDGAGSAQDGVTWLTGVCSFTDQKAEETREFVSNISAVLVKQDDAWRFHSMHFSQLIGCEAPESQASTK